MAALFTSCPTDRLSHSVSVFGCSAVFADHSPCHNATAGRPWPPPCSCATAGVLGRRGFTVESGGSHMP